jgi:hypothetical protein
MFFVVPALFFVPGLVVCAAAGLRGWRLAAVSPAVTFGLVALGGPVLNALHVRWTLLSFLAWTLVVTVVLFAATWLARRVRAGRRPAPADETLNDETSAEETLPERRSPWEHVTVGVGVLIGMGVGALAFLRGIGGLDSTAQDWDAPFHANAVRWIAEHGQAVPSAIAPIANLAAGDPYYYPITYHSLLALVVQQFGAGASWVLNAAALTVVLLWPLGIAALGLAWRVPAPVVAVAAAVSTWFSAFPYDSLWRGPLWPYVAGVALLPGLLAAARLLFERFPVPAAAGILALGVTGAVSMHPSLAFVLLVYAPLILLAVLLKLEPVRWRGAIVPALVTGALTVLVLLPVILPARAQSAGVQAAQWPEFATEAEGLGQVLLFSPVTVLPQWWLGLAGIAGLVLMVRRRRLTWVLGAYVVLGAGYAATASMNTPLVNLLSGPFYNDAWRLAALLPLAGSFAVGEAVAALGAWAAPRIPLGKLSTRIRPGAPAGVLGVTAVALIVLAVLSNGAYVPRNAERLAQNYHDGPTVSRNELAAYEWLAHHVKSGERVMNDSLDGSVWMYASAGVHPMEWTFYGAGPRSVADKLYFGLNRMDTDPAIRRLVETAGVRYVIVGRGYVRTNATRGPGLQHLERVHSLRPVFRNHDAVIYQVQLAPAA